MRVLITGAAGSVGSVVYTRLAESGVDVTGTDRRESPHHPIRVVDLLDHAAVRSLVAGFDAVIHLANDANPYPQDPVRTFRDTVGVNMTVLHSAAEVGVKKVIFASSVHAFNGRSFVRPGQPVPVRPSELPYLPADGNFPPNPGNTYGLGKCVSETMLAYFAKWKPLQGISVRLPAVRPLHILNREALEWEAVDEVFSYLELNDAARLFEAIVRADLPGYRVYFPSGLHVCRYPSAQRALAAFFGHAPRRKDLAEATSLVDISRITDETGWIPEH